MSYTHMYHLAQDGAALDVSCRSVDDVRILVAHEEEGDCFEFHLAFDEALSLAEAILHSLVEHDNPKHWTTRNEVTREVAKAH